MSPGNESFVYGSELFGRGDPTQTDQIVGSAIFSLALCALILGCYNIYVIKKMKIFHNAFGWFWASRTIGEMGSNLVHVIYSGPLTILQYNVFPPWAGITAFTFGYFFACHACVMHQVVSVNRMLAVCMPIRYRFIFTKKICKILIAMCWVEVFFVLAAYLVFPCNVVGYSPTLYEYVFVKCEAGLERDYSIVGTFVNRFCFVVCFLTMLSDVVTLVKIIQIKKSGLQRKNFSRDVRFFCQTSVQNMTMMIALTLIVLVNNSTSEDGLILQIFAFCTLIVTHLNNALALIIFNPEVRGRFTGKSYNSSANGMEHSHRVAPTKSGEELWTTHSKS
ncbi:hypothetical protein L596_019368 [Steinernema carpocapsae]|uniref:G-protein coupled receptors family 1 profile domain-containing protein n=1 Tax=Steinernema carpocapsae TaxID=34508 RepID=A0A4U5MR76_STECR|nr:hypothetical protein L596_019368 [Steinernema carpocapsae]